MSFSSTRYCLAVGRIIGLILSCSLAGFAFAKLRWRGRNTLFFIVLLTLMIPTEVTLIPRYILFAKLGWVGSFAPLLVPGFFAENAFFVFLFRQFFMTMGQDLIDAARIDGCSFVGLFWRIIVPNAKPVFAVVAIYIIQNNWNSFLLPMIYLTDRAKYTLALGLRLFNEQFYSQTHLLMAASVFVVVPIVILFFFMQRYFIQGVVFTGIEGLKTVTSQSPHIILITCDELRADALSCYGNRVIATPNLDGLAARGTRFQRAYTNSPWCLPSRCSLATGRFPHRNGSYSNFRDIPLDADIPNIYSLLQGAGYHTAHIGKCHYAPVPYNQTRPDATLPYDDFRDYYLSLGLDHLALQDDKQVSVWFMDDYARELDAAGYLSAYRDATWDSANAKVFPFPGPAKWHPDSWVGRKSAEYIERYESEQPLFLWVSFSGPHYPFDAPAEYYERVDMSLDLRTVDAAAFDDPSRIHSATYHGGPTGAIDGMGHAPGRATKNYSDAYWHDLRRNYFANVAQIDEHIGRVLASC